MIKVKAANFYEGLERAGVGNGDGFVLMVDPTEQKIGDERTAQFASISSSDGEKIGMTTIQIHTKDMSEPKVFYTTNALKSAVATLSKITEMIMIDAKESHLLLSDEKKESVIKVELKEKGMMLELPDSPDGAVVLTLDREQFVNAVRLGGYSAIESNTAGTELIYFRIDENENRLLVMSARSTNLCKAEIPVKGVMSNSENKDSWHLINHKFVQSMVRQLSGDLIQIAFTPKFMVVQSQVARFGSKKSDGSEPTAYYNLFKVQEYGYQGKVDKKELLIGMEVAMVSGDSKYKMLSLETTDEGALKVSSKDGSNKREISQLKYEGKMQKTFFAYDLLKLVINGCADEIDYFGGEKTPFLRFKGTDANVEYESILAPVNSKKSE